ncbi:DNA repair protein RadC [Candidatus Saganbacteria bacterium]|nr:DNA repair protein RadC [Candidatus Saganbacteria bacterium]
MKQGIRYWPAAERPREKILGQGEGKLSNAELLALFLGSGVAGRSAVGLARELLVQFGGLRGLFKAENADLFKIKGLGAAKIAKLKAIKEINRRCLQEKLEKKNWQASLSEVLELLYQTMRDLKEEKFLTIFLNTQNEIIKMEQLFEGSLTQGSVYPRKIIDLAIKYGASALIFVHNHPSGQPDPSAADKKLTRRMRGLCRELEIRLLDHIIVGENGHISFAEAGLL